MMFVHATPEVISREEIQKNLMNVKVLEKGQGSLKSLWQMSENKDNIPTS